MRSGNLNHGYTGLEKADGMLDELSSLHGKSRLTRAVSGSLLQHGPPVSDHPQPDPQNDAAGIKDFHGQLVAFMTDRRLGRPSDHP
jgi:hypothetical protein